MFDKRVWLFIVNAIWVSKFINSLFTLLSQPVTHWLLSLANLNCQTKLLKLISWYNKIMRLSNVHFLELSLQHINGPSFAYWVGEKKLIIQKSSSTDPIRLPSNTHSHSLTMLSANFWYNCNQSWSTFLNLYSRLTRNQLSNLFYYWLSFGLLPACLFLFLLFHLQNK